MTTPDLYRRFAESEARGWSPTYEEWAHGVATDPGLLARLDDLPAPKRQPNLLFAAARYLGIPAGSYADFRGSVWKRWNEVTAVIRAKRTQTNEPNRCAVILPLLAALPPTAGPPRGRRVRGTVPLSRPVQLPVHRTRPDRPAHRAQRRRARL